MEILFDNPFIIIILIAIISSLFKNKKKAAEGQKRGTVLPPIHKPIRSPFDEVKEIFKEVTRPLSEENRAPAKKIEEVFQEKKRKAEYEKETSNQTSAVKRNMEYIKTGTPLAPVSQTKSAENKESALKVDESKLVEAVIWAEILGPPRAKNPYRNR